MIQNVPRIGFSIGVCVFYLDSNKVDSKEGCGTLHIHVASIYHMTLQGCWRVFAVSEQQVGT